MGAAIKRIPITAGLVLAGSQVELCGWHISETGGVTTTIQIRSVEADAVQKTPRPTPVVGSPIVAQVTCAASKDTIFWDHEGPIFDCGIWITLSGAGTLVGYLLVK